MSFNGGPGLLNQASGPFLVKSSIVAQNGGAVGSMIVDVTGSFTSVGFNLVGTTNGSTGFTQPTDQTGIDPQLDPNGLQDNGGPTKTIALLPGSPAIDKGSSAGLSGSLATDQRDVGFARTFDDPAVPNATGGDGTDIGAFETQTAFPTPRPRPNLSTFRPDWRLELATTC